MDDTDMTIGALPLVARVPLAILFLVTGLEPAWIIGLIGHIRQHMSMLSDRLIRICKAVGRLVVTTGFQGRVRGPLLSILCVMAAIVMQLQMPLDRMRSLELAVGILVLAAYSASSLMVQRIRRQATTTKSNQNYENRSGMR